MEEGDGAAMNVVKNEEPMKVEESPAAAPAPSKEAVAHECNVSMYSQPMFLTIFLNLFLNHQIFDYRVSRKKI